MKRVFDYKRPFFYMVVQKRSPELAGILLIVDEAKSQSGIVIGTFGI